MNDIKSIVLGIFVFTSGLSFGQIKEFDWEEVGVRGSFDSTKYSEKELRVTYNICYPGSTGLYGIEGGYAVNLSDAKRFSEQEINRQYEDALNRLEGLPVLQIDFAIHAKNCHREAIERVRNFNIKLLQVYKKPRRYKNKASEDSCYKYVDLIFVDNSTLIKEWFMISKDKCKNNIDPEKCLSVLYYSQLDSRKRNEIAKFAILNHYYRECIRKKYLGSGCASDCFNEFLKLFITFDIYGH
jgi:hypothetical protein